MVQDPGRKPQPHDGYYDLRITAELWETYYIDHYSLLVVDHPEGSEIYTDERFSVPPPPLKIFTTAESHPFASAHDDRGEDVSATVRDEDRKYLDTFGRGPYQGLTRDHWVELELPPDAPANGPLYLLAAGWVHPTDATVNIAIGQNSIAQPEGLSIEVPDAHGAWMPARKGLGFPAGKMKTIVLDLTGIFQARRPAQIAPAHQPRDLLGQTGLGHGSARSESRRAPESGGCGTALSWFFNGQRSECILA